MHVLLNAFHPNVHYQSKALLEDPHLNVVIIMSFQNKKSSQYSVYISDGARSYNDLGVVFRSPATIHYPTVKWVPLKDTENLEVELIKC